MAHLVPAFPVPGSVEATDRGLEVKADCSAARIGRSEVAPACWVTPACGPGGDAD